MQSKIVIYEYNDTQIEFDLGNQNLMVNATEMGKIFGKIPKDFLVNEQTKAFVTACLNKGNSPYLKVEKEEDLFVSKQKTGTWMHRILALKFAAWLDPNFELWVYETIDYLLFGSYKKDKEETQAFVLRKLKIDELKNKFRSDEDYLQLERLELEQRQASYRRTKTFQTTLKEFLPQE